MTFAVLPEGVMGEPPDLDGGNWALNLRRGCDCPGMDPSLCLVGMRARTGSKVMGMAMDAKHAQGTKYPSNDSLGKHSNPRLSSRGISRAFICHGPCL